MKNILYIENKRIIKQPITFILLFLMIGFILIRCNVSSKHYDTRKESFDVLMDEYVTDSQNYSLDKVIQEGTGGLQSELYKEDIMAVINGISFMGKGEINSKRIEKIREELKDWGISYDDNIVNGVTEDLEDTRLDLSYAEGWKAIIDNSSLFTRVLLLFTAIYTIYIFAISKESELQLYSSTLYGNKSLFYAKTVLALAYGLLYYAVGVVLYLSAYILKYGIDGGGQFVFSNPSTVLTIYNNTYVEAFCHFMLLGILSIITIVLGIAILSRITKDFVKMLTIVAAYFAFIILMDQMSNIFANHFLFNFLLYKISDYMYHLRKYHIYHVFGNHFKGLSFITVVCLVKNSILLAIWRIKAAYSGVSSV